MNSNLPLTIYFDASCRLCNSEIQNIKLHDEENHLILIDCSANDFDATPFKAEGITQQNMMDALHVRDNQGAWIIGVPSFELIYRTVGLKMIARIWGGKFTGPLLVKLYPWIVKHRYALSRTGLPLIFKLWGKCLARRSHKRSQQCKEGQCSI